jgi:hypothetical protein
MPKLLAICWGKQQAAQNSGRQCAHKRLGVMDAPVKTRARA